MSFFGTLRKVKKGKQTSEHDFQKTLQKLQAGSNHKLSLSNSNSTPNLNKLQSVGGKNSGSPVKSNSSRRSSSSALNVTTDDDEDSRSTGADSVETSTSSENPYRSQSPQQRRPSFSFTTGKLSKFVANAKSRGKVKRSPLGSVPSLYKSMSHFSDIDEDSVVFHSSWNSVDEGTEEFVRRGSSGSAKINRKWREAAERQAMISSLSRKTLEERKRDELMLEGVKKFNRDPKKGMEFLVKNQLVGESAQDQATFLKNTENLSKTAIGIYMGEHDQFNQDVLAEFVKLHEFTDEHLVDSLRKFLASFRLPGEAQKIDRMMEAYASHYCAQNPDVFSNTDTCYLLSYALIMLNTTLHNPNVKDKPTLERFIAMNRDIDDGKSLDPKFLASLYESIKNEQFQIIHEDGNTDLKLTFMNADINGWLWKQGAKYKNWKRRWFVLNNNCLYYFMHQRDKVPRSIIPLENIHASEVKTHGKYFIFTLTKSSTTGSESIKSCKTLSDGTIILGSHSEFVLGAETVQERDEWVEAIQQNSSFDQYYTLLQEKKRRMAELQASKLHREKTSKGQHKQLSIRKSQISMPITRPKTEHGNLLLVERISIDSQSQSEYNEDFHGYFPSASGESENEQSMETQGDEVFSEENERANSDSSDSEEEERKDETSPGVCASDDKNTLPVICISGTENLDGRHFPVIYSSGMDGNNSDNSFSEGRPVEGSDKDTMSDRLDNIANLSLNKISLKVTNEIRKYPLPDLPLLETSISFPNLEDSSEYPTVGMETSASAPNLEGMDNYPDSAPPLLETETSISIASLDGAEENSSTELPLLETSISASDDEKPENDSQVSDVPIQKVTSTVIKHDEISLREHRLSSQANESPTTIVLDFAATATSSVC